jgi:hypothetical protein
VAIDGVVAVGCRPCWGGGVNKPSTALRFSAAALSSRGSQLGVRKFELTSHFECLVAGAMESKRGYLENWENRELGLWRGGGVGEADGSRGNIISWVRGVGLLRARRRQQPKPNRAEHAKQERGTNELKVGLFPGRAWLSQPTEAAKAVRSQAGVGPAKTAHPAKSLNLIQHFFHANLCFSLSPLSQQTEQKLAIHASHTRAMSSLLTKKTQL